MEGIFSFVEIIGTVAFALSGAMTAIERKLDLFGVLFLGAVTALGGGLCRDVLLQKELPTLFQNPFLLFVSLGTSLAVFLFALFFREIYTRDEKIIAGVNNIFDAAGLGIFSVIGVAMTVQSGFSDHAVYCIFIGFLTGTGGGLCRDALSGSTPILFRKRIYAVASIVGAALFWGLSRYGVSETVSTVAAAATVFILRILASEFHWNLPKAIP